MTVGGSQEKGAKGAEENTGARLGGEMKVQEQEKGVYAGQMEKMVDKQN